MKNLSLIINGILAVAIIILFILFFTNNRKTDSEIAALAFPVDSTLTLPIAYVNIDSVLSNYQYAKEASDALIKKTESSRATVNNRQRKIAEEYQEFQRKYQNNAFLSPERAEQEHQRIQKMASDLEQTAARLENEVMMEQAKVNNQLADSVRTCIKILNETTNYEIIISNSGLDNILFAKPKYDITNQVVDLLNKRHAGAPKK